MAIDTGYGKPDTVVYKKITQRSVALAGTTQKMCIAGPVNNVVADEIAGMYTDANDPSSFTWPSFIDGSVVDESTVVVKSVKDGITSVLDEGYTIDPLIGVELEADIVIPRIIDGSHSSAGVLLNGVLADDDGAFLSQAVKSDDVIMVLGPDAEVDLDVVEVASDTELTIQREEISTGLAGTYNEATNTFSLGTATFMTDLVKAGDELVMTSTVDQTVQKLIVASDPTIETELVLEAGGVADANTQDFSVFSNANDGEVIEYQIVAQDHIAWGSGASILISYNALRTDFTAPILIEDAGDPALYIGSDVTTANPMGMACDIAGLNGDASYYIMPTKGHLYADYSEVLPLIEAIDIHYLVPLTMDNSIIELYEAHTLSMSEPENKKERMSISCTDIAYREVKVSVASIDSVTLVENDRYSVSKVAAGFDGSNVIVGDQLYFEAVDVKMDVSALTGYSVVEVTGPDSVVVISSTDIAGNTGAITVCSPDYTRREIAEYVRNVSDSIQEMSIVRVWPPELKRTVDSVQETVEGFYCCVGIASHAASYPSQKPMTNTAIVGFDSVSYSNRGFFGETDLNVMASGGVMIMVQEDDGSDATIRQQLTTDMSSIKSKEFSFIKNLNFCVKDYRSAMSGYTGSWNITDALFDMMTLSANSVFRSWSKDSGSYGPKVLSSELLSINKSSLRDDWIESEISAEFPLPNNRTEVTFWA